MQFLTGLYTLPFHNLSKYEIFTQTALHQFIPDMEYRKFIKSLKAIAFNRTFALTFYLA